VIEVDGITRRFGAHVAVDDISFEVGQGEVVGFLGLNGAGKTTTMRILAGALPATSGVAKVAGFDVLKQSMDVRKRIGYLPENVPLYREQRVEGMLGMQARLHRLPRGDRARRIGEVLERVGVLDRRRQVISQLRPDVLILDEPTSGLDPIQRQEVSALLKGLAEDHTVLLSSHILPEVEAVCSRTILIHKGRIAGDGTVDEMMEEMTRSGHVRLEACVGPEIAGAARALGSIGGSGEVRELGPLGIYHVFELESAEDLREDVGALCHVKGWAIRELSYKRPSLEEAFGRIAANRDPEPDETHAGPEPSGLPTEVESTGLGSIPMANASGQDRQIYSLNPFDGDASRDLSVPTGSDSAPEGDPCDLDDEEAGE